MSLNEIDSPETESIPLSVVIIAENEEAIIRECIESVFAACEDLSAFEVILVDSASNDRTVEFATEYPITVLRIPEEHTVSCGAGRFVGDQVARGRMVFHIDGDMVLTETWLPKAIEQLRDPDVAGVEGSLDTPSQRGLQEVDKIGGVMLYDAAKLREIGGFDPYLLGYEDVDVGFQLKAKGYRLLRLPEVSAIHHDEGTVGEPLRRWRQGYLIAPGQAIRKWATSPTLLWRLLRRQRYKLALFAWLVIGIGSLATTPLFLGWMLLSGLGFGYVAANRGIVGAAQFFTAKAFGVLGLLVGVRRARQSAAAYPLDAIEVVKRGPVHRKAPAIKDE